MVDASAELLTTFKEYLPISKPTASNARDRVQSLNSRARLMDRQGNFIGDVYLIDLRMVQILPAQVLSGVGRTETIYG